ncbi:MAG: GntR family transcriptional regulator [Sphaerochaeta sp.]|nr:GntR family transcriptional regulator [Sphaerochaeta sp.]
MSDFVIEKQTAADIVYGLIKKEIIELNYKPGEKLSEQKIAERYNVSRDPVRKAVSKLALEGLLVSKPQFGTIVSEISIPQALDICDIRLLLEVYAIEHAVQNMSDDEIYILVKNYERLEDILKNIADSELQNQEIYSLDAQMHNAIYVASGNSMVKSVIDAYAFIIKRVQIANIKWHQRKDDTVKEMGMIIRALQSRDTEKAVSAMRVHIGNIRLTVEKTYR